jgi:predicted nuclease of predicted toxin-antitoxin system
MRVLPDENIPHGLRNLLPKHEVVTVAHLNWTGTKNGELLKAAEDAGFDVMITSDRSIPYQQNMAGRKLAIVMLSTADWNLLKVASPQIAEAITMAPPGSFVRVDCGTFSRRRTKP